MYESIVQTGDLRRGGVRCARKKDFTYLILIDLGMLLVLVMVEGMVCRNGQMIWHTGTAK